MDSDAALYMNLQSQLLQQQQQQQQQAQQAAAGGGAGQQQQQQQHMHIHHHHNPTMALQNERQVVRSAGREAIRQFLLGQNCFSCLRTSGKVVVFDTRIPIQLAFYALVEHDMQAAPLWHPVQCQFVGLLTVTDFIDILRHYRNSGGNDGDGSSTGEKHQQQQQPKDVSELAVKSIAEILTMAVNRQQIPARSFWGAESTCTLYSACRQLLQTGQDFLPIVYAEDMRVLACITYTTVLEHLVTHFREQRRLFDDSITDLGIGTYQDDLISVTPDQSLSDALRLMAMHNLSALPVVILEDDGPGRPPIRRITGVYSRSDITFLTKATDAEDAVRNLDLPLSEILTKARQDVTTPDALQTCSPQHTLQAIFESFAQVRFHRLYVVADEAPIIAHPPPPHLPHHLGGDSSSQNSVASHQTSGSVQQQQQQQHVQQQQYPRLLGVVSAKDLVAYFLKDEPQQGQ